MASNTSKFFLLSSISITIFALGQAAVNPGDLTQVCSTTLNPDFCNKTLQAASDKRSLGEIAIKEALSRANYVPEYLGSVEARAEPELAKKYEACEHDYESVITQLNQAAERFKSGKVAAAGESAESAFAGVEKSLERFKQPPADPSEFSIYCVEIQTLCQAVSNVVDILI